MGVSNAWAATQRYIYVGISNEYQNNKDGNNFGLNVWGGTSEGVKSLTWIQDSYNWDGRNYTIYRAQVYDDNNKAQFKGNNNWWDPGDGFSVKLNGTTNNAIFFSHNNDGWSGQFQQNYQVTSNASLAANKTNVLVGENVTLTPSLTSNTTYNTLKSTTYSITPNTGASISSNTFKATKAGTYTVTATVTYNAKDFTGITKTATATQTIKVYDTQYVLRGSQTANGDPKGGMAGWSATNNNAYSSATINGTTMTIVANLTNAKTQYKFKIYNNFDGSYYGQTGSSEIPNNESWTLNGSNDVKFTTTAAGSYTFIYNTSNKSIKVQYPTAYTVTYSLVPTAAANAPTTSPSISSGAYVLANTSVTFTAKAANTGYTWKGWYDNNAGTGNALSSNLSYTRPITGNTIIYAVYTANTYTVTLSNQGATTAGTASVQATYGSGMPAITPPTRDGYMFNGYYSQPSGQGIKYYNADGTSARTWNQENATLYAYWVDYSKCIFFKNTLDWENVFIYTFSNNAWWDTGIEGVHPGANKIEHGQMSRLGETDIYYYILTNTTTGFNHIAFSDVNMSDWNEFNNNKACYRGDRTDKLPLFVPYNGVSKEVNKTKYYNEGIWMKYHSKESGYYLNIADESSTPLIAANAGDYTFTATVYLTPGERTLDITNLRPDTKFSKTASMTSGSSYTLALWQDYNASSTLNLTPTTEGAYTFTLNLADGQVKLSAAYPSVVVPEEGDYRLLYVEQVVEKSIANGDEWKTIITRKKAHPSDIIKKRTESGVDTVSLHVYNNNTYQAVKNPKATNNEDKYYTSPSNSAVILQRYNGTTWEDKEHHMVFKSLETLPSMAMLPGRRNTSSETTLKYDKGIPAIQEDEKNTGNGVWNFPIAQTVNGGEVTATLERDGIKRYSGKYYIRTANSVGGWENYTIPENHMTHSLYAEQSNEFTHYYCKWIDKEKNGSAYVQFVVANDFGQAISDTLTADRATLFGVPLAENEKMVSNNGLLPANANVRFSWKEENNALHRAYLDGSGSGKEYLVLKDLNKKLFKFNSPTINLENDTVTFLDNGGWMYQVDVYSLTNSPINLTAKYNNKVQHFKGEAARATTNLIGGNVEDATKYPIRILYDFKENHLITGYVPQVPETKDVAIETNLMMIRKNHGAANQLTMNINNVGEDGVAVNTGYDAYGVLTFTESHLKGTDNWKVTNDKTFYWISFPFDVNLKDAFGFGKYAYHWYIEYYDGAARAKNGLFLDSGTYWEYVMEEDAENFVLKANQGYVLWLNVAQIQADGFFTEITKEISIYFPAAKKIAYNFQTRSETINLPPQYRPEGSRRYKQDSNWRLIGVPSYANTAATTTQGNINFVYVYDAATNKYNVTSTINDLEGDCFQSMHAYMVQYEGDINWTTVVNEYPSLLAARQNSNSTKEQHVLRLELLRNGSKEDHTYIQLQDDKATEMFDMNLDLTKMSGSGGNIYSIIPSSSDPIQVAANVMPIEECIIPLGIKTTKATNYTFAMPEGTDGIVVELIDYETNTRTNMLLDSYTVNLGKGTFDNRFALHVQPSKVTTSVEDINTNSNGVKKYLIDGILYMQKDGVLYDAQGKLVR